MSEQDGGSRSQCVEPAAQTSCSQHVGTCRSDAVEWTPPAADQLQISEGALSVLLLKLRQNMGGSKVLEFF